MADRDINADDEAVSLVLASLPALGNGAFTEVLIARCGPAAVTAIDPSEGMLNYARMRPGAKLAEFRVGDARADIRRQRWRPRARRITGYRPTFPSTAKKARGTTR
jgi:hypothetical protein